MKPGTTIVLLPQYNNISLPLGQTNGQHIMLSHESSRRIGKNIAAILMINFGNVACVLMERVQSIHFSEEIV